MYPVEIITSDITNRWFLTKTKKIKDHAKIKPFTVHLLLFSLIILVAFLFLCVFSEILILPLSGQIQQIKIDIFLICPRKQDLAFHVNCLPRRQFSGNVKAYFLKKRTGKFHGEFMSPALFLFEVLKMVKLTRGPLVLYQLPKYWSRKPVIKNYFKILKKPHAYLQTILKASVKFQKDRLKTVVGVTGSRYLLPIHFCSIRTQKMSKLKMRKKW